jgi:hypothetical protein
MKYFLEVDESWEESEEKTLKTLPSPLSEFLKDKKLWECSESLPDSTNLKITRKINKLLNIFAVNRYFAGSLHLYT